MLTKPRYRDAIETIHQVKEIIDHNIDIIKTLLQYHGEDGEAIRAQVKAWADQFYQQQEIFIVILGEVQATYIMTYNAITKVLDMQFQREYELEDK